MCDYSLKFAKNCEAATVLDDVPRSWEQVHKMYQTFGPLMEKYDVFICPTNGLPAVKAEHDPWDQNFRINNVKVDPENGWILTYQFNMLHYCPVISLPSGCAANGCADRHPDRRPYIRRFDGIPCRLRLSSRLRRIFSSALQTPRTRRSSGKTRGNVSRQLRHLPPEGHCPGPAQQSRSRPKRWPE